MRALLFVLMIVAGTTARSEDAHVEIGATQDHLSNGYSAWRSQYADVAWKIDTNNTIYGSARATERFALHDDEFLAGAYHALDPRWTLLLEANASATHQVLPRHSELAQIESQLPAGFGAQIGVRHTQYNDAWSTQAIATLERYWAGQAAGYTVYAGRVQGGGTPVSQRAQWRYYFTDVSNVGVSYATGVEIETLPNDGVLTSHVRTLSVTGAYALTSNWSLNFEGLRHQQGSSYVRHGVRLGLRYGF